MIKQTYLIICILLGIWLTACQDDDPIENSSVIDGDLVEVSIKTNVPAITVQTKADATDAEKKLTHVDVLVFEVKQNGDETFAYRTTHSNNLNTLDYDNIEIKAKLQMSGENNEKYRIVFIANLEEEVNDFFNNNPNVGTLKDVLLKELTFKQEEIWTDDESNFRPLPMWGESSGTSVVTKNMSSTAFGTINLLRSVARIELSVSISGSGKTDGSDIFEIKSVRVYNTREEGRVAPDPDNFSNEDGEVTAPSLTDGTVLIDTDHTQYTVANDAENKVTGIYINENEADEVFLIIEAIYKKENPDNQTPSFYKVGFYNTEDEPVDILRNFTYNMIITGVNGEGEETEEDAVNSTTSNLTVSMTEWSGGEMKYVVFGGKYYLAVSDATLTIPKSAGTYELKVKTNYSTGWKAAVSEGSWITGLSPATGSKDVCETVTFNVAENDTFDERTGIISFSCGEDYLSLEVHIIQTDEEAVSLKIQVKDENGEYIDLDSNTLLFHSGNHYEISPRELKITWTPASENLIVDFLDPSFEWGAENDIKTIYENGTALLKVVPAPLLERSPDDWYPEDETEIKIQIGGDSSTKRILSVIKRHFEVYIERSELYELDGEKHSFKLYSNTAWKALFVDTDILRPYIDIIGNNPPEGGNNLGNDMSDSGVFIEFNLIKPGPEVGSINSEVVINVEYDDLGETVTKRYVFRAWYENKSSDYIAGGDANCYVLQPNGKKIRIPVSQANRSARMGIQIQEGDELTPVFIWTDHEGGYGKVTNQNSAIKNIEVIGDGSTAILEVTPGEEAGNAVIGITKKGSQDILWSWHLWVSDFDPNNNDVDRHGFRHYQFLDRNLGALTDDASDPKSFGFYYQWGRKDPFPSAKSFGSKEFIDIFDEYGNKTEIKTESRPGSWDGEGPIFLETAIRKPNTFITHSDSWLTASFSLYQNEVSQYWNENETSDLEYATKGVFDPCPDGWKTSPGSLNSNNQWYVLFSAFNDKDTYAEVKKDAGGTGPITEAVDIGVWPYAGTINGSTGTLTGETLGRYWTGNKSPDRNHQAIHSRFGTNKHPSEVYAMSHGLTVRCMRRTDNMR